MSLYGALAEAFRRNERVDRGIGAVTGSLAVTTGVDQIQSVWLAAEKATAPEADILSWAATNNVLTIYAWKIAVSAPTITMAYAAAGAVTAPTPGSSPDTYQNTASVPVLFTVQGATVLSVLSVSRDGTNYYNALSAATVITGGSVVLQPGDYAGITYTGSPTYHVFPFAASTASSSTPAASLGASSTALNVSWGVIGTSYAQHPYPGA